MKIRIKLDDGAFMPERAHETDAGLDLKAPVSETIPPRGWKIFETGVHVEIPEGYCGIVISKSGLNFKKSLQSTGLIDSSYRGEITLTNGRRSEKETRSLSWLSFLLFCLN